MVRDSTRLKIRAIFKTFLLLNKGKKCTTSEVCRFINGNRFAMMGHKVTGSELANYWRVDHASASGLLFDVNRVKSGNGYLYFVEDKGA